MEKLEDIIELCEESYRRNKKGHASPQIMTIEGIMDAVERFENKARTGMRIDCEPSYQRIFNFNKLKYKNFITSIWKRDLIQPIILDYTQGMDYEVVDGVQRIGMLKMYIVSKEFKQLPIEYRSDFMQREMTITKLPEGWFTSHNDKVEYFIRLNSGTTPMRAQQILRGKLCPINPFYNTLINDFNYNNPVMKVLTNVFYTDDQIANNEAEVFITQCAANFFKRKVQGVTMKEFEIYILSATQEEYEAFMIKFPEALNTLVTALGHGKYSESHFESNLKDFLMFRRKQNTIAFLRALLLAIMISEPASKTLLRNRIIEVWNDMKTLGQSPFCLKYGLNDGHGAHAQTIYSKALINFLSSGQRTKVELPALFKRKAKPAPKATTLISPITNESLPVHLAERGHIVPFGLGGSCSPDNIQFETFDRNRSKGMKC